MKTYFNVLYVLSNVYYIGDAHIARRFSYIWSWAE